jgi:tetratricopeptide (TPR) repeat protein
MEIAREIGDRRGEGAALGNLGNAYAALGDARKAIEFYEQQLVIVREIGDRRGEGNALGNLGMTYKNLGAADKARGLWQEALAIFRAIESPHVHTVQRWLDDLDGKDEEGKDAGTTVQDFVRGAIQAARAHDPQVQRYFEAASKLARDEDAPAELRALGKVLQKILAGVKNPDLSQLPEELARLVKEELEK